MPFKNNFHLPYYLGFILLLFGCHEHDSQNNNTPPNEPGKILLDGSDLTIKYFDKIIFNGKINNEPGTYQIHQLTNQDNGKIQQVWSITSTNRQPILITGTITASNQSFPCEVDRPVDKKNLIRHCVGLSRNKRNHAIYDRLEDWALSVDFPAITNIVPVTDKKIRQYEITLHGLQIGLRFRPRYYQKHRELNYFRPWNYAIWDKSVAGWCSWFAWFKNIDEQKIQEAADVLEETLVPFGLEYLQIDDGYQREPGDLPETWYIPNKKFPSGLGHLSRYIIDRGLKPGIWTYTSFHQKEFAEQNPQYFIKNHNGKPAYGRWVGYVLDGSQQATIDSIIKPIYKGFRDMEWQYFKVDALRHLRYEGYNSYSDYFRTNNINLVDAYRNISMAIREEIGRDHFMLGCWGIRPELIGIIDGCRIGGDGYGYACLAQFNSFNNVIWRNDPDHIELSETEAYRSSMVTSLTGSLFMLTDKPEIYKTDRIEPAKRSLPVLFTLPGQIYDVDPTRSIELDRVNTEISGDGQRVFDGNLESPYNLFMLEINKDFENWVMLGRTEEHENEIYFDDLGLNPENEYHVFEFWTKKYLGSYSMKFIPGSIPTKINCQLFCLREKRDHPQILSTTRHISGGGLELENVTWQEQKLSGTSTLVVNDIYDLILYEPDGFSLEHADLGGLEIIINQKQGNVRTIRVLPKESQTINWSILYN